IFQGQTAKVIVMEEEFTEYLVSLQQDLTMVRLHAQYLSDIRNMQYCLSLKICDLSGNFLTNIDALECCTSLIKLDLHSNQGTTFQEEMKTVRDIISKINYVLAHHSPHFCCHVLFQDCTKKICNPLPINCFWHKKTLILIVMYCIQHIHQIPVAATLILNFCTSIFIGI
uniref:Uncharacterized protein n=1 Tax=Varanus komodoensis TaxID=61221 RepID=A0A8D2INY3_VARKO